MAESRDLDPTPDGVPKVVVYIIKVDPKDCDQMVKQMHETIAYVVQNLTGLIEARVMISDDSTRIILESSWQTRHDWSYSRWDEEIQKCFGKIFEVAKEFDLKFYGRREIIAGRVS